MSKGLYVYASNKDVLWDGFLGSFIFTGANKDSWSWVILTLK